MKEPMGYSANGYAMTENFEGLELTAYKDSGGVWTIGYGHVSRTVCSGMTITEEQAEQLLELDLHAAMGAVNRAVLVTVTQNQFDALVDFTFNCGTFALATSTLLKRLNAGDILGAAAQFLAWSKVKGVPNAGLLRRRLAERDLFMAK